VVLRARWPRAKKSFLMARRVPAWDGEVLGISEEMIRYWGNRFFIHWDLFCLGWSFVSVIAMISGFCFSWRAWIRSCAVLRPWVFIVQALNVGCCAMGIEGVLRFVVRAGSGDFCVEGMGCWVTVLCIVRGAFVFSIIVLDFFGGGLGYSSCSSCSRLGGEVWDFELSPMSWEIEIGEGGVLLDLGKNAVIFWLAGCNSFVVLLGWQFFEFMCV